MLDVTVCILSYNRPAYLREAVVSVLAQTKQPQRIAIYDNGSDSHVFESIGDLLGGKVEWIGADDNHPFVWNFNRALRESHTKYTVLMHDDDRLCPPILEVQTQLLDCDPAIAVTSSNGYFINDVGSRSGATLAPKVGTAPTEFYTSSGQVALKYASNSCIPFSPAVYRTDVARSVKFREEFVKVCDAVYFCDLADVGSIAYQIEPMYECRVHSGQDSCYFPYDLMNQLEEFFWTRNCGNNAERATLHSLLGKQHTARNLKRFLQSIKIGNFSLAASLLMEERFKFSDMVKVIGAREIGNVFRKW